MIKPQMYANLHNHTTHSDGVWTVGEITEIAYNEGYRAFAVTDHDTVTGNAEMSEVGKRWGMESIFGCEFMTRSEALGMSFHLTAYDFDPELSEMKEYLRRCSLNMTEKTRITFERAREHGDLPRELLWETVLRDNPGVSWFCNDHVFRTMKKMGIYEDRDYPHFFKDIFGVWGRDIPPLYEKLPLEEIVPLIRRAGGLVLVAHPHNQLEAIPALMRLGVEGLEVWHPDLFPEEIPRALKIAKENNLYISGGTDHSGLCGGQYCFFEDPTACEYYIPELSQGTTKELYEEIRDRRLMAGRAELIDEYLEYYSEMIK
ncbi:MAG: PHP domain-containing protein [Clostridia bacterium]|nr:PHP domain-containing protein [Clostridia bacterium]